MRNRHYYAHWLDPECLSVRALGGRPLEERRRELEGVVKMHAVLGDSICLSDVQLIESGLLLHLFGDTEFVQFISRYPDFLRLVAKPTDMLGAKSPRLAILGKGLARILEAGDEYRSSTFDSDDTMPQVARLFEGISDENAATALFARRGSLTQFVRGYNLDDKPLVVGLFRGLEHFVCNQKAPIVPPDMERDPSFYHRELEMAYDRASSRDPVRLVLAETLKLADNQEERVRRALMVPKIPKAAEPGHPDRIKYLTIIQAWNVAVSRTIHADENSALSYREAFPIPVLLGRTTHCTSDVRQAVGEEDLFRNIPRFDWHPSRVTWATISTIREECSNEIENYQRAVQGTLGETETLQQKLDDLCTAVGKIISTDQHSLPTPSPLLASACTLAGWGVSVGSILFGHPAIGPVAGGASAGLAAYTILATALKAGRASELGRAIQAYARQYNIHQED